MLLHFAGHGSQNSGNNENDYFNLWNDQSLYVSNLASELTRLPVPVVLVMVQRYSGAFANVIFRHADPGNE